MKKLRYINLNTTDAAFNLACEQYVFENLSNAYDYFMLWQNDNAVIIGKYQNTLAEINEKYVSENGVKVVRRLSGGGAVFHDLGNLNFTIISDSGDMDNLNLRLFCEPVVAALLKVGVEAEINGRNDITICGLKFSGNSQYLRAGRIMHHGTMMFSSDLDKVNAALNVDKKKIESKGKQSVRSRVTSISEHLDGNVTLEDFRKVLLETVADGKDAEEYVLTDEDVKTIEKIKKERYETWEWNYGASRECDIIRKERFEGVGTIEVHILLDASVIKFLEFKGDFFSKEDPELLASKFVGIRADSDEYKKILEDEDVSKYFLGATNNQVLSLLTE